MADARQKVVENVEVKSGSDVNRRKQTRGKGNSNSARGRGSVNNDQTRIQNSASHPSSNGLQENSYHKVYCFCAIMFGICLSEYLESRP